MEPSYHDRKQPVNDPPYGHANFNQVTDFDPLAPLSAYKHGWLCYHPAVARALGSVEAAVLIHKMLQWSDLKDAKERNGWFYAPRHQILAETGLSRDNQETVRKRLGKFGVLEECEYGNPCRLWFRVNQHALHDLLAAYAKKDLAEKARAAEAKAQKRFPHPVSENAPSSVGGNTPNLLAETPPTSGEEPCQQDGDIAPNLAGSIAPNQLARMRPTSEDSYSRSDSDSTNHSNDHSNDSTLARATQPAPVPEAVGGGVGGGKVIEKVLETEQEIATKAHAEFAGHPQQGTVAEYLSILHHCKGREECFEIGLRAARDAKGKGTLGSPIAVIRSVAEKYLAKGQETSQQVLDDLRRRNQRRQNDAWERRLADEKAANMSPAAPEVQKLMDGRAKGMPVVEQADADGDDDADDDAEGDSPKPKPAKRNGSKPESKTIIVERGQIKTMVDALPWRNPDVGAAFKCLAEEDLKQWRAAGANAVAGDEAALEIIAKSWDDLSTATRGQVSAAAQELWWRAQFPAEAAQVPATVWHRTAQKAQVAKLSPTQQIQTGNERKSDAGKARYEDWRAMSVEMRQPWLEQASERLREAGVCDPSVALLQTQACSLYAQET